MESCVTCRDIKCIQEDMPFIRVLMNDNINSFHDFKVLHPIGATSATSKVYQIQMNGTNKMYVLKCTNNIDLKGLFQNKLEIHKKINISHSNFKQYMSIAEAYHSEGIMIEPFLEGYVDFEDFCKNESVTGEQVTLVFIKIIVILIDLSDIKFNHNDLHMRNIMINTNTYDIKLIDFDWSSINGESNVYNNMHSKITIQSSNEICHQLFYNIQLKYGKEKQYSSQIDLAMLFWDFKLKFFNDSEQQCEKFTTEFEVNTSVQIKREQFRNNVTLKVLENILQVIDFDISKLKNSSRQGGGKLKSQKTSKTSRNRK